MYDLCVDIDKLFISADKTQADKICVLPVSEDCSLGLVLLTSVAVEVQLRASFYNNIFIRIHRDEEIRSDRSLSILNRQPLRKWGRQIFHP